MEFKSEPIPVKPFVAKFFNNGNVIKPYILSAIYRLLDKSGYKAAPDSIHTQLIRLPLSATVFKTQGFSIQQQHISEFNRILEGYIKDRFECELEAHIRASKKINEKFVIQKIILDLREDFGLSESDLSFETIKKSLSRYCSLYNIDIEDFKNFPKCVPRIRVEVQISSECVKRVKFMRDVNISHDTYARWKKNGLIKVIKHKRQDYVNVAEHNLPEPYKANISRAYGIFNQASA